MYFRQGLGAGRAPTQAFLIIGVAGPPSITMPLVPKCTIIQECVISIIRGLEAQKLSEAKLPYPSSGGVPSCGSYPRLFDSDSQWQEQERYDISLEQPLPWSSGLRSRNDRPH
jgi:hypothetical protein